MTLENFAIIESTLREGEQFAGAQFTPDQKVKVAMALDEFGVEMLELSSPCASEQSEADVRMIVKMNLNATILTHIRCNRDDATQALDTGVGGLAVVIGTSAALRNSIHATPLDQILYT